MSNEIIESVKLILQYVSPIASAVLGWWVNEWTRKRAQKELEEKDRFNRRMSIFKDLTSLRGHGHLYPEYVKAFNLVEIEFNEEKEIIDDWKELMDLYNSFNTNPELRQNDIETRETYELRINSNPQLKSLNDEINKKCERRLASLLSKIAQTLSFNKQQLELLETAYFPVGLSRLYEFQSDYFRYGSNFFHISFLRELDELKNRNRQTQSLISELCQITGQDEEQIKQILCKHFSI